MGLIDEVGLYHELVRLHHAPGDAFAETWQDQAGIDPNIWTTIVGGTGAVGRDLTEAPYQKVVLTGPANGDTARLHSVAYWSVGPGTWGDNTIYKRLVFSWEAKFDVVASIDNADFFMGLGPALATRASNDIIGFILTADALNSITDSAGVETVNAVGAPVLTNWHLYALEVYAGAVNFYIDGALAVQHTTNLPDALEYLMFYLEQEAAANGGELHVGALGCYHEFIVR